MTPNKDILDRLVRHLHWLERYKTGEVRRIVALLIKADNDLVDRIAARLARMGRGDTLSKSETDRLKALLKEIQTAKQLLGSALYEASRTEMEEFAAHEADFKARAITGAAAEAGIGIELAQPSMAQFRAVVAAKPFQGRLLARTHERCGMYR